MIKMTALSIGTLILPIIGQVDLGLPDMAEKLAQGSAQIILSVVVITLAWTIAKLYKHIINQQEKLESLFSAQQDKLETLIKNHIESCTQLKAVIDECHDRNLRR